jgi:NAD(P)H dehydrogenase (quinone)
MANILVTYYSRSGATAKMAELIAQAARKVKGAQVTLKKVADVDPKGLADFDAIVCGSPTYYGQMAAEVKKMFDASVAIHGQLEGKVGGAFTSAANIGGGNETTILSILEAMLIHGMIVKGTSERDHYRRRRLPSIRPRNRRTGRQAPRVATKRPSNGGGRGRGSGRVHFLCRQCRLLSHSVRQELAEAAEDQPHR